MSFWLALASAAVSGFITAVIGVRLAGAGISPFMVMAVNSTLTTPVYILLAYQFSDMKLEWAKVADGAIWPWVLGLGALYVLYNSLFYLALKYGPATQVGMVQLSAPLFIGLVAWAVFGQQQFTLATLAGWLLIAAGVACIYMFKP